MQEYIKFTSKNPWKKYTRKGILILWAGYLDGSISDLCKILIEKPFPIQKITQFLKNQKSCFGLICAGEGFTFAATDRLRGYPVFYHVNTHQVSNHAQSLDNEENYVSKAALTEFAMAGYVTGNETLFRLIKTLQAGEWLYRADDMDEIQIHTYYQYAPSPVHCTCDQALKGLGQALDNAIQRTLHIVEDNPVFIPLSGGLDSRLILAKLQEHGCNNIRTYSYGLNNNFEARMAKKIASMADVPWQMVPAKPDQAQILFQKDVRKSYENFSHGYNCVPNYTEFEAVYNLKTQNIAPAEAFIINGQTGDFISGGHIPAYLYNNKDCSLNDVLNYIIEKHFSMWLSLVSARNKEALKRKFTTLLIKKNLELSEHASLMRQYESFEWRERQTKVVAHGQRCYDFFGYNWALPLWDKEVMDFFECLPFDMKFKQNLFKDYLKAYNYKGLFDLPAATPHNWAWHQSWILAAGQILGLLKGQAAKDKFYRKMIYYSSAHCYWALFGHDLYKKHYEDTRNMISFCILDFIETQNWEFPKQ